MCTGAHDIYVNSNKSIARIMLSEKRKKTQRIFIQIRNKKSVLTLLLFSLVLKVLAKAISHEKE